LLDTKDNNSVCASKSVIGTPYQIKPYQWDTQQHREYVPELGFLIRLFRRHLFWRANVRPWEMNEIVRHKNLLKSIENWISSDSKAVFIPAKKYERISEVPQVACYLRREPGNAPDRSMANLKEVISDYKKNRVNYHMLFIDVAHLNFTTQVSLLSHCSIIISPEGASFVNQLYQPLNSILMELQFVQFEEGFHEWKNWHTSISQYLGHLHAIWKLKSNVVPIAKFKEHIKSLLESKHRNREIIFS